MGAVSGLLRMLSREEMERIHDSAAKVLEDTGIWVDSEAARRYYRSAGCVVNESTRIVKFPRKTVDAAVERMRKQFADTAGGDVWARIRYSRTFYTTQPHRLHTDFTASAGGFPPFVLDPDGRRRTATLRDVIDGIRLADALENIDMTGLPCSAQEIPHGERPIRMTAELLKRTRKIGGVEAFTVRDVHAIAEMCDIITGSREASLRTPAVMGYGETRSPLCLDGNMADLIIEYARLGFPQSIDCMPCGGTSAPAASAGVLVVGCAESIAGMMLGFAVNPRVRMGVVINPSYADMKTMLFPYASANKMTLVAAVTQILHEYYGCPTGVHSGKTDACVPNAQAGFEKALSTFVPVAFGTVGIGTLGNMESGGITFSPVQLVIDNEMVGYIRKILGGIEVNDATLAVNVIHEVGPGGSFLEHQHTLENMRRDYFDSKITERLPWTAWEKEELRGIEARAADRVARILATHDPHPLAAPQAKEIDSIVRSYLGG